MLITSNSSGARPCSDVSRFHDSLLFLPVNHHHHYHHTSNCSRYNKRLSINRKLHTIVERTVVGEPYREEPASATLHQNNGEPTDVMLLIISPRISHVPINFTENVCTFDTLFHVLVSRSSDGPRNISSKQHVFVSKE